MDTQSNMQDRDQLRRELHFAAKYADACPSCREELDALAGAVRDVDAFSVETRVSLAVKTEDGATVAVDVVISDLANDDTETVWSLLTRGGKVDPHSLEVLADGDVFTADAETNGAPF